MASRQIEIRRVIREYIQPESTLATMQGIYRELTGNSRDFTRWEDAEETFVEMDWSEESYRRFLELSREFVEGHTEETSESYFDIVEPENDIAETAIAELSDMGVSETDEMEVDEGFAYRQREDGVIEGTYYYANINIEITAEPDIRQQPDPNAINFRIDPDEHLLIVESTYPAYVQKVQSVFNNETSVKVAICGDLTVFPNQADESVISFINEFREEEDQITHD